MKHLDDRALVALATATDDEEAFSELVRRHYPALTAFISSIGNDASAAEDIAQQAITTAYVKLEQFRGEASFKTWLFRIALRERLQAARREASRQRVQAAFERSTGVVDQSAPTDPPAAVDIERMLDVLTDAERVALMLCDGYGYTHAEAADLTGAPLGSLKTYVRRAREKARRFLDQAEKETRDDE